MIHFFGILGPSAQQSVVASEAPRKKNFFGSAERLHTSDELLSPAEQDMLILTGKQPEFGEERRFTQSLAFHSL